MFGWHPVEPFAHEHKHELEDRRINWRSTERSLKPHELWRAWGSVAGMLMLGWMTAGSALGLFLQN